MAELFKGYIPSVGKAPMYSVKSFDLLKEPPKDRDYVGALKEDVIQVDVDDEELAYKVLKIAQDKKLRCDVLKTKRGLHFYFKNTTVTSQKVHFFSAVGIPCDYGLGSKDRVVPIRVTRKIPKVKMVDGNEVTTEESVIEEREFLQTYSELETLPPWLLPISKTDHGISTITTRNQSLFNYILVLQSHGLNREEIRQTIKIINAYMLESPLPDKEIDMITRDEAFSEEMFFDEKGRFKHDFFGNYMLNNSNILSIKDQVHIYTKNGVYTNSTDDFEKEMLRKIPSLKDAQRKEVYKYISLQCTKEGEFSDAKYIGLKNSILDIETMSEFPYSPSYIINNKIPFGYDTTAKHELLDKTLDKIVCHDKSTRLLLEEMIGYSLYRKNLMQVCFILTGEGSNGKSTLLNLIKRLLGDNNYTSLDLRELEDSFKPSELYNKLANLGDDISAKFLENSSIFKKVVTGESFMVQRKYGHPFKLESYATQIFCANELPTVSDKSDGFNRRIILIPFKARFSKLDVDFDPFIESKLMTDESIEYLLKLAIEGLKRVIVNGSFTKSELGEVEMKEYIKSNNNVLEWLENEPKIENESAEDIYLQYQVWCTRNGCNPVKKLNMSKEIKKVLGLVTMPKYIDGKTVRVFEKST